MDTSGGEIAYGGRINAAKKHIQPTLIINPKDDSPLMNEEIFGPILPIIVYRNLDEVISYINKKPKPLAVYFYGNPNHQESWRIFNTTSSGAYLTNECIM
jgi:aldehyde dehydrogenase (NAD+)